jgi:hypothetical protein
LQSVLAWPENPPELKTVQLDRALRLEPWAARRLEGEFVLRAGSPRRAPHWAAVRPVHPDRPRKALSRRQERQLRPLQPVW